MSEMFRTLVSSNLVCVFQTWRKIERYYIEAMKSSGTQSDFVVCYPSSMETTQLRLKLAPPSADMLSSALFLDAF